MNQLTGKHATSGSSSVSGVSDPAVFAAHWRPVSAMVKIGGEGQITSREAGMHKIPSTDRISTSGRTFEKLILLTHSPQHSALEEPN